MHRQLFRVSSLLGLLFVAGFGASSAAAAIVWQDTFTRTTGPTTYDYTTNGSNDYTLSGGGTAYALNSNTLSFIDSNSGGGTPQGVLAIGANQFAPASYTAGTSIQFSVDMRVNSMIAGSVGATSASAPRIGYYYGNLSNGSEKFTVGFSHVGGVGDLLGFYAVVGDASQTSSTVIGGGTAPGFTFGSYSATATANDTNDGVNGNSFYRVVVGFTQGQNDVTGSIIRLDASGNPTADVLTFSRTLSAPFNFTGAATDGFSVFSGQGGTSDVDYDNLVVNVTNAVPEPTTLAVFAAVGLVAAPWIVRRRRS